MPCTRCAVLAVLLVPRGLAILQAGDPGARQHSTLGPASARAVGAAPDQRISPRSELAPPTDAGCGHAQRARSGRLGAATAP